MSRIILSLVLLCLCFFKANAEQSKDLSEIESEIRTLERDIAKYNEILENTEDKKSVIEENLKRNENSISDLIKKINKIEQELSKNRDIINRLDRRRIEFNRLKTEQKKYIEQQLLAAYEVGNGELPKLILNQEDPNKLARLLTYYDYFIAARAKQIDDYNHTLSELDHITAKLAEERLSLQSNGKELDRKRLDLATTQRDKREVLKTLFALAQSTGNEISKREKNRAHLEKLLTLIQNKLGELPAGVGDLSFQGMRGSMLLPVNGKITETFGKVRSAGRLKWNGLFIEAAEGLPVYAVHYGRVIFSDWLRGFGLLMIINHGQGYMSLYGHNQVLYLETGDPVKTGDMIATVGDSGGQNQTGLYFEIRINGEPSDPEQWCVQRNHKPA